MLIFKSRLNLPASIKVMRILIIDMRKSKRFHESNSVRRSTAMEGQKGSAKFAPFELCGASDKPQPRPDGVLGTFSETKSLHYTTSDRPGVKKGKA